MQPSSSPKILKRITGSHITKQSLPRNLQLALELFVLECSIWKRIQAHVTEQAISSVKAPVLRHLSWRQVLTLLIVYQEQDLNLTALAELLRISPPSASALVGTLVEKGLLNRRRRTRNRRSVTIRIAANQLNLVEDLVRKIANGRTALLVRMESEEGSDWNEMLDRLEALNKLPGIKTDFGCGGYIEKSDRHS